MSKNAVTKLGIRADMPTAQSSSKAGANTDAIGFNMLFIALRKPALAVELMKLYKEALELKESGPVSPDEDYLLALDGLQKTLTN
jgi:hypothetical protein